MFDLPFFLQSFGLGIALAMDAFSVSLANGLNEPDMPKRKTFAIGGIFGFFQGLMPLIGWFCIHKLASVFNFLNFLIPWVALGILGYIGGKMLYEGIKEYKCRTEGGTECPIPQKLGFSALMIQGIATSIDALSAGLAMQQYKVAEAIVCSLIIMTVTCLICIAGVILGKKFGTALSGGSAIFGGSILIIIGLEIFITSFI